MQLKPKITNFAQRVFLAISLMICAGNSNAQDSSKSSERTEIESLKLLVNPTTMVVAQLDMNRLQLSDAVKQELQSKPETAAFAEMLSPLHSMLSALSKDRVIAMVDVPFSTAHAPTRLLAKQNSAMDMKKLNEQLVAYRLSPVAIQSGYIATSAGGMAASNKIMIGSNAMSANDGHLSPALAAVEGDAIRVALLPPDYLWKSYEELLPNLPAKLGGLPTTTITHGFQWAAIGLDPASLRLRIIVQSRSPEAAQRFAIELPKLIKFAAEHLNLQVNWSAMVPDKSAVVNDRIEITFNKLPVTVETVGVISKLLQSMLDPMRVRDKQQRFMQIALAIHNYIEANKVFPPSQAGRRPDGSSYLSWRVHILPYIGEEKLYSQFRLNEPWDSEHNLPLANQMPAIFAYQPANAFSPSINVSYTPIVAPVGEGTIFGGNKLVKFDHVEDGSSITILFLEVNRDHVVPWTAPQDYEFPLADPAAGLEGNDNDHFICAMADGSVHYLSTKLPKKTLLHLFQMNDGQPVEF